MKKSLFIVFICILLFVSACGLKERTFKEDLNENDTGTTMKKSIIFVDKINELRAMDK